MSKYGFQHQDLDKWRNSLTGGISFHDTETNSHGSGLGLSIAKTIIELHEGELTLTSNKKGTSLIISLPLIKKSS